MRVGREAVQLVLIMATVLFNPQITTARTWAESIELVEKRADELWEKGKQLGASTWLGTAVNELDIPRHKCAILGRMLEKAELISELEQLPEPKLSPNPTEGEAHELMLYSHSLSNWAHVATYILKLDQTEKIQIWNLDCVGEMGIPTSGYIPNSYSGARFNVDGRSLFVVGDIKSGFFRDFENVLDDNPQVETIVLGSAGGSVSEALKSGVEIRERGLDTSLSNNCYSACPLIFGGGVRRTIWSPYPKLGFHQMSDKQGRAIKTSHELYFVMENYFELMGADPHFILASMLRASPSEMYEPEFNDLCEYGVTTWIQRLCFGNEQ